jgi:hypothetical protein
MCLSIALRDSTKALIPIHIFTTESRVRARNARWLKLTAAGAKAIAVDETAPSEADRSVPVANMCPNFARST